MVYILPCRGGECRVHRKEELIFPHSSHPNVQWCGLCLVQQEARIRGIRWARMTDALSLSVCVHWAMSVTGFPGHTMHKSSMTSPEVLREGNYICRDRKHSPLPPTLNTSQSGDFYWSGTAVWITHHKAWWHEGKVLTFVPDNTKLECRWKHKQHEREAAHYRIRPPWENFLRVPALLAWFRLICHFLFRYQLLLLLGTFA